MGKDLGIKKIINAYYCKTNNWCRDFLATRLYDGIVMFTEGEIEYYFEGKTITAKKGDFLFLPGNQPYSGKKKTETTAFFVLDFECYSKSEFEEAVGANVFTSNKSDIFQLRFSEAVDAWKKQQIDVNFTLKAFIYSVLSDFLHYETAPVTKNPTANILEYIYENIHIPTLSVALLCKEFYISESQLRRNIHRHTGLNPNEYILMLRLNKAKSELTYTDNSISVISANCGFSSPYYFSRCFTENNGITPSKYRKLTGV